TPALSPAVTSVGFGAPSAGERGCARRCASGCDREAIAFPPLPRSSACRTSDVNGGEGSGVRGRRQATATDGTSNIRRSTSDIERSHARPRIFDVERSALSVRCSMFVVQLLPGPLTPALSPAATSVGFGAPSAGEKESRDAARRMKLPPALLPCRGLLRWFG